MIHPYGETLLSELYPGNQHSTHCLQEAVLSFEKIVDWPKKRRLKVIWRLDSGFGADKHINWLRGRGYQVIAKGASNSRSAKLATQVKRWIAVTDDKWVGAVQTPKQINYPLKTFSLRYLTPKGYKHRYLYSSLALCGRKTALFYDLRGGAETEFRTDKTGGFFLQKRRKQKFLAQQVWIILTDIAHNYLAWFCHHCLSDSPFAQWGALRISRDLFHIPGRIERLPDGSLFVSFLESHPYAADLWPCLARFWQ